MIILQPQRFMIIHQQLRYTKNPFDVSVGHISNLIMDVITILTVANKHVL